MKNIYSSYYLLFLIGVFLFTVSCQKDDGLEVGKITYKGQSFVAFDGASASVSESSLDPSSIKVLRGSTDASQPLEVSYTVSSLYQDSNGNANGTFTIENSGTLTIPAGEFSGIIGVRPVDNGASDGNKLITITLSSVSNSAVNVGYPGPEGLSKTFSVTIEDDDCPLVLEDLTGTFDVVIGGTSFWDPNWEHTCEISLGEEPNTLVISNFWDIENVGAASYSDIVVQIDPATLTASVPDQEFYVNATGATRSVSTDPLAPGSVSTCNLAFTLNFIIYRTTAGKDSRIDTATDVVFTKQ